MLEAIDLEVRVINRIAEVRNEVEQDLYIYHARPI